MDKEYKSYAKTYWVVWIILITALFILFSLRIFFSIHLYLLDFFTLFIFFGTGISLNVLRLVHHTRFFNYLKKNHYEKWKEVTTPTQGGLNYSPDYYYISSAYEFLFSEETLNDPRKDLIPLIIIYKQESQEKNC